MRVTGTLTAAQEKTLARIGISAPLVAERLRAEWEAAATSSVVASPSGVRELRPGDVIVRLPSRVTPSPRREERSPLRERQPVALATLFAERDMAMRRARGATGPPPAAPRTVIPSPPRLLPVAEAIARRRRVMDEHRATIARRLPWELR